MILSALAEALEDGTASHDIPIAEVARRAGVAERTVYRHFPTKADMLAALSLWARENYLPLIPLPSLEDIPDVTRRVFTVYETRPELTSALAVSEVGREVRSDLQADVVRQRRALLDAEFSDLDSATLDRVDAVLGYLDQALAWHMLRTDFGLTGEESGAAVGWAMRVLVDALHRGDAPPSE